VEKIAAARNAATPLLGFDAAFVGPDSIQLSLNDSWDYTGSSWPSVSYPYAHAIQFIGERAAKGLRFEIVLGEPTSN
jgi:hypothetical protein